MRIKDECWSHFHADDGVSGGLRRCKYCNTSIGRAQTVRAKAHFLEAHYAPESERVRAALVAEVQRLGGTLPAGSLELQYVQRTNQPESALVQPSLQSAFSGRVGDATSRSVGTASTVLGQLVASALVHTNIAANKMDNPHWKHVFRHLQPKVSPPSRADLLGKHLDTLYERSRGRLESMLADAKFIGATTDIWTEKRFQAFQNLNVTFVDDKFVLQTLTLDVIDMPDKHTGKYLAEQLSNAAEEFGITERILSITTDGARNNASMATELEIPHIRCIAHKLHLVIADTLLPVQKGFKAVPPDPFAEDYAAVRAVLDASGKLPDPPALVEPETESEQRPSRTRKPTTRFAESSLATPALKALFSSRQAPSDEETSDEEDAEDNMDAEPERYAPVDIVEMFTKLCVTFTGSVGLKKKALDVIKGDDVKEKVMACRYGDTRWSSILWMILPLVQHETSLRRLLEDNQLGHRCPSAFDFARARILCALLEPFAVATKTLQTSKVATHLILPMMRDFMRQLRPDPSVPTDEELSVPSAVCGQLDLAGLARFREQMKHLLRSNLAARIRSMSDTECAVFDTADFFNPKRTASSLTMRLIGAGKLAERGLKCDEKAELIVRNLDALQMTDALCESLPDRDNVEPILDSLAERTDIIVGEDVLSFPRRALLKKGLVDFARTAPQLTKPVDDFSTPGNIEAWWAAQEAAKAFPPAVFDAVRCVFSILATSASSEQLFGQIVSPRRTRLSTGTLKKLAVVQAVGAGPRQESRKRHRQDNVTFAHRQEGHVLTDDGHRA